MISIFKKPLFVINFIIEFLRAFIKNISLGLVELVNSMCSKLGSRKFLFAIFSKEILFVFETEQEMNDKEKELITEEFVKRPDTYNVGVGGEGGPHFKGRKHTEETLQLIRERSGQPMSDYTKQLLRENNKRTNASRGAKNSAALKGRPKSEEHKQKIREALLKRKNTAV